MTVSSTSGGLSWIDPRCTACFTKKLGELVERFVPEPQRADVLRKMWEDIHALPSGASAPVVSGVALERMAAETGILDPFEDEKREMNELALSVMGGVRERVAAASDPFAAAVRASMAGNSIDVAAPVQIPLVQALEQSLVAPLAIDDIALLREKVGNARDVLYLCDNAGEVVLDRLFLEALDGLEKTVVVRGGPAWNDALRADADTAGLNEVGRVIDNGVAAPGTVLDASVPEVRERFRTADIVISKGQGNYETLARERREGLFFVLLVKCDLVSDLLGTSLGAGVVLHAPNHP